MFATNVIASGTAFSRTALGTIGTIVCASVCLLAATVPAPAVAAQTPRAKVVHYDDLNLASSDGRKQLETRIRFAASAVCANGRSDLDGKAEAALCARTAIGAAQPRMIAAAGNFAG